jgi:hypothetical protein
MSRYTNEQLENMLEDVVNELDLSEAMIEKHGPLGTPPAELVRLVLQQKDLQIRMLKAGMKQISTAILLILLPFFAISQDTLKAELKIKQGNWIKPPVIGYVVLKDCVVIEYLRVNTWRKKEKLLHFKRKHKVVDYWLL